MSPGWTPQWKCPYCPMGIPKGAATNAGFNARKAHWAEERSEKEWRDFLVLTNNAPKACIGALNARAAKRIHQAKLSKHTPKVYRNPLGTREVSYKYICLKCRKQAGTIAALDTYPCNPMEPKTKAWAVRARVLNRLRKLLRDPKDLSDSRKQLLQDTFDLLVQPYRRYSPDCREKPADVESKVIDRDTPDRNHARHNDAMQGSL